MTLEEAIKHAEEKAQCDGRCGEDHAQLAMWLKELRERRAAELEKHTEKRTETHACDCISRQAAIDHWRSIIDATDDGNRYDIGFNDGLEFCISDLSTMPSAQPEIIYCKKCEHWTRTYGDEQWGLGDCDVFDKHLVMCNGYCAWAERRRDG